MKTKTRNRVEMYRTVITVLEKNEHRTLWSTLQAFADAYQEVSSLYGQLKEVGLPLNREGVVAYKKKLREEVSHAAYIIASAVTAYAAKTDDIELEKEVNFTRTEMAKSRTIVALGRFRKVADAAARVIDKINDHAISAETLAQYRASLERFETVATETRATATGQGARNDETHVLMERIETILKKRMDRLIEHFRLSAPGFYSHYKRARRIVDRRATRTNDEEADAVAG
jgi:hypothetical protein